MIIDDWGLFAIGVMVAMIYLAIGFGVARMLAKIKERELRIFDLYLWFLVCIVFAIAGDCE